MRQRGRALILKSVYAFGARLYLHSLNYWAAALYRHIQPGAGTRWLAVSTDIKRMKDVLGDYFTECHVEFRAIEELSAGDEIEAARKFKGVILGPCLHELNKADRTLLLRNLGKWLPKNGKLYIAALTKGRTRSENLIFRSAPQHLAPLDEERHSTVFYNELKEAGFSQPHVAGSVSLWVARVSIVEFKQKRGASDMTSQ